MKRFDDIEQRTPEWFQKRGGTISGTRLKGLMGTPLKRKDTLYEILAERLAIGIANESDENPMERGTRLEPDARSHFEFITGLKVEETGYAVKDENEKIALSPDGIISDTDETEMIEIKSPERKNYVKYVIENKVPEEYTWQVIQYFTVNDKLRKLYFVIYNPDIKCHPMHIVEVYRDQLTKLIDEAVKSEKVALQEVEAMYLAFPGVKEQFENI